MPQYSLGNALPESSTLGVNASTVVKAGSGKLYAVAVVTTVATTASTIADATATTGLTAANDLLVIPVGAAAGTLYQFFPPIPFVNGLVFSLGTAGGVSLYYT